MGRITSTSVRLTWLDDRSHHLSAVYFRKEQMAAAARNGPVAKLWPKTRQVELAG